MAVPSNILEFFASFIERELGIQYNETNYYQLENRLQEIARLRESKDIQTVYQEAKEKGITGAFRNTLLDVATNNETSFFRDPLFYQSFKETILEELLVPSRSSLRVWSAASSFGQEPYTIAMTLLEANAPSRVKSLEILASDIADRALARATKGVYSQLEVDRGLPKPLLEKYFKKNAEGSWEVKPEVKKLITFKKVNLLEPFGEIGTFDLIFCRNVLIYQKVENKKLIVSKMTKFLNPGGYLIMGAGESMMGVSEAFETVRLTHSAVYRFKPGAGQLGKTG